MLSVLIFESVILFLLILYVIYLLYVNHKLSVKLRNHADIERLQKLAFTDALTGINNRTAYNIHIADFNQSETKQTFAIILFDIDNFKTINDTQGHLAGDEVLKFVAGKLVTVFPAPTSNVYRIGGDEFAVISKGITEKEIINALIYLNNLVMDEGEISLSNGYSLIDGTVYSAFKNADEMLYADKFSKK